MDAPQVIVVGGGGTGGALAHDLVLRGLAVTLLERGELTSGTTGRHHGLLHSGARYAVNDPESAVECIAENRILRRIAPGSFEENGGLFVALTDEDMDYLPRFLAGCAACGIPTRELAAVEALAVEPGLNPALKAAVWVPDATMDAMRLPLRFFSTAQRYGAQLCPFTEVTGLLTAGRAVTGVTLRDHLTGAEAELAADLVVNATGPLVRAPGRHGRSDRAGPALTGGTPGAGRPAVQPGRQPPAPGRRRGHRGPAAAPVDRRDQRLDRHRPRQP